jgi:hypothetical protein
MARGILIFADKDDLIPTPTKTLAPSQAALVFFLCWIGSRSSASRSKPLTARLAGCRAGREFVAAHESETGP